MSKLTRYENLKTEVQYINKKIREELPLNNIARDLYKGVHILMSNIPRDAQILFLGINPGDGYFKGTGEIVKKYSPSNKNSILEVPCQYSDSIYNLFEVIESEHLIRKSAISNLSYISTENVKDLKNFRKSLPESLLGKLLEYEQRWTEELIRIINPKMIFLVGFQAFNEFSSYSNLKYVKEHDSWKTGLYNNIPVIACKRIYSTILNVDEFSKKLKSKLLQYELI